MKTYWPLGARGDRPFFFRHYTQTVEETKELTSIPGVSRVQGGFACTADAAPILAEVLGQPCPRVLTEDELTDEELADEIRNMPGLERYRALGFNKKLRPYQREGALFLARRAWALNCDAMRLGKEQPVDSFVATPDGWRRMGEIKVGDFVLGSNGQPTKVLAVFPQGMKPVYRVTFSDGSSVEAGAVHLWQVAYKCGGRRLQELTLTTELLRTRPVIDLDWPDRVKGKKTTRLDLAKTTFYLPLLSSPLTFTPVELPIPPYTFGQLLGNGALGDGTPSLVTNIDDWPEVEARLRAENAEVGSVRTYGNAVHCTIRGVVAILRDLHVDVHSHDKFVPQCYLRAAVDARVALLQALLDTDGSCSKKDNRVVFSSTSEQLAHDFVELVEGLGGVARLRRYDRSAESKPVEYQVQIRLPSTVLPFSVKRKASRFSPGSRSAPTRTVQSVEYTRDVESVCIKVAAEDHLYVTERCIITHNTIEALAATVLVEARKTLIVCPAIVKYHWANEVAKWLGEEALILEGRGGDEMRQRCNTCNATGRVTNSAGITLPCAECRMRNGQSNGYRLWNTYLLEWDEQGALASECLKHPEVIGEVVERQSHSLHSESMRCPRCVQEIYDTIAKSRVVIVNYDLLVSQKFADAAGQVHAREDLRGWSADLARHNFDVCIGDEAHRLRGVDTSAAKRGTTRRERFIQATENIPVVWLLTGTPIYGFVRDLFGLLDAASKGACTSYGRNRSHFIFAQRYCDGKQNDYGFEWNGRSNDAELKRRLPVVKIQRALRDVSDQMPKKVREVVRVEPLKHARPGAKARKAGMTRMTALLTETHEAKLESVMDNVLAELAEGRKCVVFNWLRRNTDSLGRAIEKACQKNENKTKMREVNAKVWAVHGELPPLARIKQADAFREHKGAACFVAGMDAIPEGISLKSVWDEHPTTSVHFADLHWQPSALLQTEARPYDPTCPGLTIYYYVVRDSIDEHIEATVLRKFLGLGIVDEIEAVETRAALNSTRDKESLQELMKRLTTDVDFSAATFQMDNDDLSGSEGE